jgi:hypothetical protein
MLHPVGQVPHDVIGVVAINFADMIEPRGGLGRIAEFDRRWTIQIQAGSAGPFDPSTLGNEAIPDQ